MIQRLEESVVVSAASGFLGLVVAGWRVGLLAFRVGKLLSTVVMASMLHDVYAVSNSISPPLRMT